MQEIIFSKKDHKYSKGDQIYTSVSKTIEKYKNSFDKEFWSTYKGIEKVLGKEEFKKIKIGWNITSPDFLQHALSIINSNGLHMELAKATNDIIEEWRKENDKSIIRGNNYHDTRERISYEKGYEINPFDNKKYKIPQFFIDNPEDNNSETKSNIDVDLFNLEDGYYPELLLWNNEHLIAGQADKIFIETKKDKRYVDIDDYKTNKKIKTTSYYTKGKGNLMMKPPINHLMDCNYVHYCLQISMYAWMMEQFGYKVRNLSFHHFNKKYKIKYMKPEIEKIFNINQNKSSKELNSIPEYL